MNKLILAGAAALAFTAIPATAQDTAVVAADGTVYTMTADQQAMYDGWPVERQTVYTAWPSDVQSYYWTLTPAQVDGWWLLNDDQRVRIYKMTPEQRATAWTQIAAQMNGSTVSTTATASAAATTSASPRFVSGEVVQSTPAGYMAATEGKDLPVCKADQQDGCINSWEKNKTGTRPLNYWPGKPASEIEGKLPANPPSK